MAERLAFLGLGQMGQAISKNIVDKGKFQGPIALWNRTPEKAQSHAAAIGNAVAVETIEAAIADATIVWSCLSTEEAVKTVYDGILAAKSCQGKVFLECSTISTEATNQLAEKIIASGGQFVAMPVFGPPGEARKGALVCLPTGHREAVQRVLPFLTGVIGKAVIDLSDETPGLASRLKLIGNVLIVQMIESVAEAHLLAAKTGIEAGHLHKVIDNVWPGLFSLYSHRMMTGEYYKTEPVVDISMAKHVADHVLQLADSVGAVLPAYNAGVKNFDGVEKYRGANQDISGIYGALREGSGLNYES